MAAVVAACVGLADSAAARQATPGAALYARAGWDALAAGQPHAAAEAFERALATDPKAAALHLGAGTAAFLERRDSDAAASLERALELDPALWRARELLGLVRYRMRDLDGAIRLYEALVAEQPARAEQADRLARWRREAELRDRMRLEVGSRFTVAFEGADDADIAEAALTALEQASQRIGDVLGEYPVAPIHVVLYTAAQFRDITRAPDWAGGAFDAGVIRVPVRGALANRREFDRVLAHEYVHALVFALAPSGVPAWVNEGLAVALQYPSPAPPPSGWVPMRLHTLERGFGRLSRPEAERAYVTSGVAMARLIEEAGGFAVANLVRDLGNGVPFSEAFSLRVQRPFADFETSLTTPR